MSIEHGIPAAHYHAHPAISKSGLDLIARSPAHFKYAPPREETRTMLIGSATHAAILEPALYAKSYLPVRDADDRSSSAWKAAKKAAVGAEYELLTGPESERIDAMSTAVRRTPGIAELLASPGRAEVSIFTTDPITGLAVRIRIDWLVLETLRALDLKTTQDLRNDKFARSVIDYRYHVQQAFYSDAFFWETGERLRFDFGVIESAAPHVSKMLSLPDDVVEYGRMLYRRDLETYARCLERNEWPGPEPEITTLITPPWLAYKMDDDMGAMTITTGEEA
jgi:hypothetical protein